LFFIAYNWSGLAAGSLVVDVGGGVGTSCLTLAAKFPELKFVVQDQEKVIEQGKEVSQPNEPGPLRIMVFLQLWNAQMPAAISSGQVALQGSGIPLSNTPKLSLSNPVHDIFTPQPRTEAAVFFLKQILHDWSDEYCVKILTQLSAAATREIILLLLETVIPLASSDPDAGDGVQDAPAPLLPNYGAVNDLAYSADMVVCTDYPFYAQFHVAQCFAADVLTVQLTRAHADAFCGAPGTHRVEGARGTWTAR